MYYVKNLPGVRVGNSCQRISFQIEYLDKIVGVEIEALQNIRKSVFLYGYWERVYSRTFICDHLSEATTPHKRLPIQNTPIFPVKALELEPLVNDHLP